MSYCILTVDGRMYTKLLPAPVQEMQRIVGGYIEVIRLLEDLTIYANESGKLIGAPPNRLATILYRRIAGDEKIIVGDVIVFGGFTDDGDMIGLSAKRLASVQLLQEVKSK
jgi:hypothetical protein